jgi:hypothetical protein
MEGMFTRITMFAKHPAGASFQIQINLESIVAMLNQEAVALPLY